MRPSQSPAAPKRKGSIAPLTCVLLVFIIGMVAFAVDMSWLVLTRSELQNVADSAALAAANRIGDNFVTYSLPNQTATNKAELIADAVSTAKYTAKTYAAANSAGSVSNLTLLDSDIEVGHTKADGTYVSNAANKSLYPNTVKVTMRRDATANQSLNMFFATVIGVSQVDVQASARAMAYGGSVNSFRTDRGRAGMLPVTYDVEAWDNFIKTGKNPDGLIMKDADGNPTLQLYPSIKDTGNFGLISLNDSHVGASTMSDWIHNGVPSSDLQTLKNNGLIPLSSHKSAWDWNGENGFKASNVMDINEHIGQTFIIPLFTPKDSSLLGYEAGTGNGSHYNYNIVRFVGIKIMPGLSKNRQVIVQPAAITDPTMILDPGSITALGTTTSSTFVTALAPPKLTD